MDPKLEESFEELSLSPNHSKPKKIVLGKAKPTKAPLSVKDLRKGENRPKSPSQSLNLELPRDTDKQALHQPCQSSPQESEIIYNKRIFRQLTLKTEAPSEESKVELDTSPIITQANRSLTLTQESKKLETPLRDNLSGLTKKRKSDLMIRDELKQMKTEVQNLANEPKVQIKLNSYRKYPLNIKTKAITLVKLVSVAKVSAHTGIPESTIRRWRKVGTARLGVSGRKPQFLEIEKDLLKIFKDERRKGTQITNQIMLREARKIAEREEIKGFVGSLSWLDGFKRRNQICYRKSTRVKFWNSKPTLLN